MILRNLLFSIALAAALGAVGCGETTYEFDPVSVGDDGDSGRAPRAKTNQQFLRSVYADLIGRAPEVYDVVIALGNQELGTFRLDEQTFLLGGLDAVGDPAPMAAATAPEAPMRGMSEPGCTSAYASEATAPPTRYMATAGGTGSFFAANSPAELETALAAIADELVLPSCTLTLTEVPDDDQRLAVFFDDVAIPRSPGLEDGWEYDAGANAITLYGSACETLQSGAVDQVRVDYGCSGPVVE